MVILGDFNARILLDLGIPRHVGPNFFPTTRQIGDHPEDILENRDLFLDFLVAQDLVAVKLYSMVLLKPK